MAVDFVEAARWYRVAAEAGHDAAQLNLGYLYFTPARGSRPTSSPGTRLVHALRRAG